ncbi:porin [Paraburkholderia bonniea]|uniref:porin n=1 Tax=Paraburkholderia bonniea TaxID=2152891 RepID=UPI0012909475|nr:porin [Paraburkholderia bonniea]WJF91803.1 porin [Paraburkholderia bonniea]WJF95122.1 porin [Paraburkholderia bonniea]
MSISLNKSLTALAVSAVAALLSTSALAQSSVTLYGEIDAGLAYVNNVRGNAQYKMTSGLIDGSYWGLKGTEDLGGGNKALFVLERGFSIASGEGFNDHPVYVGLSNESFGTVTLGHQYDSIHDYFAPFTLTGGAGGTAFAHPFDNDNANNSYLARNSVKYASPSFGGFSFGGMYAFSNGAGQFANNRAYSVGANYQNGPFNAGAAYLHVNGRGNTSNGAYEGMTLPGTIDGIFNANVQTQNTYGAGASYALGNFTLGAAWSRSTYTGVVNADTALPAASAGFSNYEVNGVYQLTPAFSLAGMYTYTKGAGTHWNEGALQADYQLSKRTDTYLETVYQRAASGTPAIINTANPSMSSSQFLVAAGIRHRF